jgi:hypothetical protein
MTAAHFTNAGPRKAAPRGPGEKRMNMATLFVALALLLAPTSVSAECAWLLWTTTLKNNRIERAIDKAFETQRACEDAIPNAVQQHVRVYRGLYETVKPSPKDPGFVVAHGMPDSPQKQAEGDSLIIRVSCWPLGLQPSGVAGGAQYHPRDYSK